MPDKAVFAMIAKTSISFQELKSYVLKRKKPSSLSKRGYKEGTIEPRQNKNFCKNGTSLPRQYSTIQNLLQNINRN